MYKNDSVTRNGISPFIRRYVEEHDIVTQPQRMLEDSYRDDEVLLATPLLRWYIKHGHVVIRVDQVIETNRSCAFVSSVTSRAMKHRGNSG